MHAFVRIPRCFFFSFFDHDFRLHGSDHTQQRGRAPTPLRRATRAGGGWTTMAFRCSMPSMNWNAKDTSEIAINSIFTERTQAPHTCAAACQTTQGSNLHTTVLRAPRVPGARRAAGTWPVLPPLCPRRLRRTHMRHPAHMRRSQPPTHESDSGRPCKQAYTPAD